MIKLFYEKILKNLLTASQRTNLDNSTIEGIAELISGLNSLNITLNGNPSRNEVGEKTMPTINERRFAVERGIYRSTYGPTATHLEMMNIIDKELAELQKGFGDIKTKAKSFAESLYNAGGPTIQGLN